MDIQEVASFLDTSVGNPVEEDTASQADMQGVAPDNQEEEEEDPTYLSCQTSSHQSTLRGTLRCRSKKNFKMIFCIYNRIYRLIAFDD